MRPSSADRERTGGGWHRIEGQSYHPRGGASVRRGDRAWLCRRRRRIVDGGALMEAEFPEDRGAYDNAGNYLGECEGRIGFTTDRDRIVADQLNNILDIKVVQMDRAKTMPGYRLVTFD